MSFKFIFLIIILISLVGLSSAIISTPSFCCEKSLNGGVCLNLGENQCDPSFQTASTSCESTSFCRLGTCYDSKEGFCMENVPQKVCTEKGGSWSEKKAFELPQCKLGCCIISDQAAFVPLVRCKRLSTSFGIELDYRPSVPSEGECIALANSQDNGACVTYTSSGVNTCKFTTRGECGAQEGVIALNVNKSIFEQETGKKFFKDMLCSAEELNTECARQIKTNCYQGRVHWFDSCDNRENVYSSDKDISWNKGRVADPDEICERTGGSRDCGNCDYLLGSRCAPWSGILGIGKPKFGDYFCEKTTCTDTTGKNRLNGESWCVYDLEPGKGYEKVGSRHFRQICVDGKIITDPCGDFRNQICIHSGISTSAGEFSTAACRVNRWQDCSSQTRKNNCENIDLRDCIWTDKVEGMNFSTGGQQSSFSNPTSGFTNPLSSDSTSSNSGTTTGDLAQGVNSLTSFSNPLGTSGTMGTGNAIANILGSGKGQWEIDYDLLNKVSKFNKTEALEGGLCVPLIPPGSKFWEEGSSCSIASANCEVIIRIKEEYDGLFAGLADKKFKHEMLNSSGSVVIESECLEWAEKPNSKSKSYSLIPKKDWAMRVNSICTSIGDCGANININDKYTDDGYIWKYKEDSFSLLSNFKRGLTTLGTGKVINSEISSGYIINDKIKLGEDSYVLVKK
jgi:hypothetical protein